MALPPSEELSRWTVGHVSNWLTKCSLSAFRDDFLQDGIDGSKLLRLKPHEVNQRYKHISSKKRNVLIDHLNRIESLRLPPSWNAAPQPPPRLGTNSSRMPAVPPVQNPDDSDGSDAAWSDEFDDDDDYLEPASKPLDSELPSESGYNTNGNQQIFDGPEEAYEIPEDELEEIRQQPQRGLERKPTIVDRLRDELVVFKERNREPEGGAPPPRPPRSGKSPAATSPSVERRSVSSVHHRSPMPVPNSVPPEDTYEVMNDVITETQKTQKPVQQSSAAGADVDLPPRPAKRGVKERPQEPQPAEPAERSAPRPRQPYQVVKKPGGPIKEQDELSGYDWYHGKIGRDHAQKIFVREQKDGMFLIRKSERDPKQPFTLVLWHGNRIWNIPIRKKDNGLYAAGKFKDGESEFATVAEIVEHFKVVSLNLKSDSAIQGSHTLTIPAPKH